MVRFRIHFIAAFVSTLAIVYTPHHNALKAAYALMVRRNNKVVYSQAQLAADDSHNKIAMLSEAASVRPGSASSIDASFLALKVNPSTSLPSSPDPAAALRSTAKQNESRKNNKSLFKRYSTTVREGGIEGVVVPFSTTQTYYRTPQALQDKIEELTFYVDKIIQTYSTSDGSSSIGEMLRRVRQHPAYVDIAVNLATWRAKSAWVAFVVQAERVACSNVTSSLLVHRGGNKNRFPDCLIHYMSTRSAEEMRNRGLQLRNVLLDTALLNELFDVKTGLCTLVAFVLHLRNDFCKDTRDVFLSVPYFVAASGIVQSYEQQQHGKEAAMVQLYEQPPSQTDSKLSLPATAQPLKAPSTIRPAMTEEHVYAVSVISSMWKFFGLHPLVEEAKKLYALWYNDPIHKWRLSVGLLQWICFFGVFLIQQVPTALIN